ncbi:hypothetical protein BT69DRAFT_1338332 [Atractiella rhizophila]|nr:hypothetical protein BT69DRAFT_1338332 [Atractiella rhizophila]
MASKFKQFLTVLVPISIAINLLVLILLATVTDPSLQKVNRTYYTWLTPKAFLIGIYWLVQGVVGIVCMLLFLSLRTPRLLSAKDSVLPPFISSNVPISQLVPLPFIFLILPLFAGFYVLRLYLVATCFIAAATLLGGWAWVAAAIREWKRWGANQKQGGWKAKAELREGWKEWTGDWATDLFLLSFINLYLPHLFLLTFGWYEWKTVCDPEDPSQGICIERPKHSLPPHDDTKREWITFGVLCAIGLIDCGVVFWKRDVVWTLGTIYLFITIILGPSDTPLTIFIPLIMFSVLLVVTLIASFGYRSLMEKRELRGRIRLEEEEEQGVERREEVERT